MKRKRFPVSKLFFMIVFFFTQIMGQIGEEYQTIEDIEEEWQGYTTFQKDELMGFCDFLFSEEYYERAILAYFKFLFLYPDDELLSIVYYKIARSYEELGNYKLATEYYQRVQRKVTPNTSEYITSEYRIIYLSLLTDQYDTVYERSSNLNDPYMLIFQGYAHFSQLQWDEAKESFQLASEYFDDDEYKEVLILLMNTCDEVRDLPLKSKVLAGLSGIFPGGGRIYLCDWIPFAGTMVTTGGLGFQITFGSSRTIIKLISGFSLVATYLMNIWGTIGDVDYFNNQRVLRYVEETKSRLGPEIFMDFREPEYLTLE